MPTKSTAKRPARPAAKVPARAGARAAAAPAGRAQAGAGARRPSRGISRVDQESTRTFGYSVRVGYRQTDSGWRPEFTAFFGDRTYGSAGKALRAAEDWLLGVRKELDARAARGGRGQVKLPPKPLPSTRESARDGAREGSRPATRPTSRVAGGRVGAGRAPSRAPTRTAKSGRAR